MSRNLFENNEAPEEPETEIVVDVAVDVPDEVLERLRAESGFTSTADALMQNRQRHLDRIAAAESASLSGTAERERGSS